GDPRRLQLAYSLVLSLPGTPVLRYGDEIGMGEDLRLKERNAIRTPMQWSARRNAGFSTAERLVRPVVARGPYGFDRVNVEELQRDGSGTHHVALDPYGYRWFRRGEISQALARDTER